MNNHNHLYAVLFILLYIVCCGLKEIYQQKVHNVLTESLPDEQHFQFFQMDI